MGAIARGDQRLADSSLLSEAHNHFCKTWFLADQYPDRVQWDALSEAAQESIRGPMVAFAGKVRVQLANLEAVIEEHGGREAAARLTSATPPKIIAARLRLAAVQQAGPSDSAAAAADADAPNRATAALPGASSQTEDAGQAETARAFRFGTAKGRKSPPDKVAKQTRK